MNIYSVARAISHYKFINHPARLWNLWLFYYSWSAFYVVLYLFPSPWDGAPSWDLVCCPSLESHTRIKTHWGNTRDITHTSCNNSLSTHLCSACSICAEEMCLPLKGCVFGCKCVWSLPEVQPTVNPVMWFLIISDIRRSFYIFCLLLFLF